MLGQHVSRFLPAEEMVKLPTVLAELMSGNASSDRIEKHSIRLDGSLIYVEATAVVIDFQGETAVQLLIRDMTDRKRAELELAAKEKEFSRVIKRSPEPIILERMTKVVQIDAMMDFIEMKLKRLDGELVASRWLPSASIGLRIIPSYNWSFGICPSAKERKK